MSEPSADRAIVRPASARIILSAAVIAAATASLLGLDQCGRGARAFSTEQLVVRVDRPEQAYELWQARAVRGRILLLFGPFPHAWPTSVDASSSREPGTFLAIAALENLVRRMYVLVPDEDWEQDFVPARPGFYRPLPAPARGFYLDNPLGLPVVATTPSSLPALGEPALVYVDRTRFDPAAVQRLLSRLGVPFDLLVSSAGL